MHVRKGLILSAILCSLAASPSQAGIITTGNTNPALNEAGNLTVTEDVNIGFSGTLGTLSITDNSILTVDRPINTQVNVSAFDGPGELNVSSGGKLRILGENSLLDVGRFSDGTVNVSSGGSIEGPVFMGVGTQAGGNDVVVNVDGAGSSVALSGTCTADCIDVPAGTGAYLAVGSKGIGTVNITNGASFTIDPLGTAATDGTPLSSSGIVLGGERVNGFGGVGTLNIDGSGSELIVLGAKSFLSAGRAENGTGIINVSNGGRLVLETQDGEFGLLLGDVVDSGEGRLTISGAGSLVDAGIFAGVGADGAGTELGNGRITLVADDPTNASSGGTLKADFIRVGMGGQITGTGTLMGDVLLSTGTIDVGASAGEIRIDGNLLFTDGVINLEVLSRSEMDRLIVTQNLVLGGGVINVALGFLPNPGEIFDLFDVMGDVTVMDTFGGFSLTALPGVDLLPDAMVGLRIGGETFAAMVAVPEPGALGLLFVALLAIALGRRRVREAAFLNCRP